MSLPSVAAIVIIGCEVVVTNLRLCALLVIGFEMI